MCGAPAQEAVGTLDVGPNEAVLHGVVRRGAAPVPGAYVRLLDGTGEFTAEVQTSATGYFRFYAAPGGWTLRTLLPGRSLDTPATATRGTATLVEVAAPA